MSNRDTTKLTLENEHGTYTVEIPRTELNLEHMFDDLVMPVLYAAGYHPDSVARYMDDVPDDMPKVQ